MTKMNKTEDDELGAEELSEDEIKQIAGVNKVFFVTQPFFSS